MPLWGFVLCFICATLWAASPILVNRGMAISGCTPNEINPIRSLSFFASTLLFLLVLRGSDITLITSPLAILFIFMNVTLGYVIGDVLYFASMKVVGVSLAVPIANSYPILVTLTSWMMLGEPVTIQIFFGVAIVVGGLLALRLGAPRDDAEDSPLDRPVTPGKSRMMRGFILAILAGLSWALGAPLNKVVLLETGIAPIELTFYRSIALLILAWGNRCLTVRFFKERTIPLRSIPRRAWVCILSAAVLGLTSGSIIYATCLQVMPVAVVTVITATSPFMAALFGHFVMKERLTTIQWAGVVSIIVGSVVVGL